MQRTKVLALAGSLALTIALYGQELRFEVASIKASPEGRVSRFSRLLKK